MALPSLSSTMKLTDGAPTSCAEQPAMPAAMLVCCSTSVLGASWTAVATALDAALVSPVCSVRASDNQLRTSEVLAQDHSSQSGRQSWKTETLPNALRQQSADLGVSRDPSHSAKRRGADAPEA